jgi:hypothetical protein
MTTRTKKVNGRIMLSYFTSKGTLMSQDEYVQQKDMPIKPRTLRKIFGAWARMLRILENIDPAAFAAIGQLTQKEPSLLEKAKLALAKKQAEEQNDSEESDQV